MAWQPEVRVVAEAAVTGRGVHHLAVPGAIDHQRLRIVGVAHQHQHAVVVGAAVGLAVQLFHQLGVVALVRFRLAGKARRLHPGLAAQRFDADAGIVGQRRQPGQAAGVTRLFQRVFQEGVVRLRALRHVKAALRDHLDAQRRQQGGEFFQLAGVIAGQHQFFDHALLRRRVARPSLQPPALRA
ncbi:hypothetical protein D3C72_1630650 [compost metagenome]